MTISIALDTSVIGENTGNGYIMSILLMFIEYIATY